MTTLKLNLNIKIKFYLFFLLFHTSLLIAQTTLPKTSDGWTMFEPSKSSLIVYVSSSDGNDVTGSTYAIENVGDNPLVPKANFNLKPFKTFEAAFEKTRNSQAD
jgi:hypothetical protein